jgi:glucosyl-3-phosphoglycerate synthase
MIVKTRLPADLPHEQWERLAPATGSSAAPRLDLAARVDKWFAENTFDSDEFENIADLVRLKERQGITISLGLPALNEAETIGAILTAVKRELVDRYPLLDEMVVIDSQSQDRTREIAADLGIPVHIHQKTLKKDVGERRGKGEALWKSLHVLRGDIVAWIDTDIKNIHPRFVYGIIGPLLRYPRIQYVKGYYKRPIRIGGSLQSTGGGRVTELTARPLFNFFFPELSGLIQPLAGEFAGRRPLLEQLPFFTGYGVETGLLIDILEHAGLDAIGQVDLKRRVHRNQGLESLSAMSFTILQVVMRRLEERRRVRLLTDVNTSMKLIQHNADGFHVEVRALEDMERPPMKTIPAYWNYGGG